MTSHEQQGGGATRPPLPEQRRLTHPDFIGRLPVAREVEYLTLTDNSGRKHLALVAPRGPKTFVEYVREKREEMELNPPAA